MTPEVCPNCGALVPRQAACCPECGADEKTGYIGNSMYNHGFASLALADAYGAVQDERIAPVLQKAINLILTSQEKNRFKAWRYTPDAQDADSTVSGACFVAK